MSKECWSPSQEVRAHTNIAAIQAISGVETVEQLRQWSVLNQDEFWRLIIGRLGVVFRRHPNEILSGEGRDARWCKGSILNVVETCLNHPADRTAIVAGNADATVEMTYGELARSTATVAERLLESGLEPGSRIAMVSPMTLEAVVTFLGIIRAGCTAVPIPDSFSASEIGLRLRISQASLAVTQDQVMWNGRTYPLFEKVVEAGAEDLVVIRTTGQSMDPIAKFSVSNSRGSSMSPPDDRSPAGSPEVATSVQFSSGTTSDPKAIVWDQMTPIKAAADAHLYQDIHPGDVAAWPTNLGWMMGPWLVYGGLMNGATIALYDDAPTTKGFVDFIDSVGVTMLGLVPSIVSHWRSNDMLSGASLDTVTRFSSTGEVSSDSDMSWLMSVKGPKPVIEYCGGTEIGGGFIAATMMQPSRPCEFTTTAFGMDIVFVDDDGQLANEGELFIVPPALGMSSSLLNADHDEVYYTGTPTRHGESLRRHGDAFRRTTNGTLVAAGRTDDTMNLGGIKVGSIAIEAVLKDIGGIRDLAAVGIDLDGPSKLVIFVVPEIAGEEYLDRWRDEMQAAMRDRLNPLFKIEQVVAVSEIPRTASQKKIRRLLASEFIDRAQSRTL